MYIEALEAQLRGMEARLLARLDAFSVPPPGPPTIKRGNWAFYALGGANGAGGRGGWKARNRLVQVDVTFRII